MTIEMQTLQPDTTTTPAFIPQQTQAVVVSVVIPTYKEADNLPHIVPQVSRALAGAKLVHEIILVDDNSQDGSDAIASTLALDFPVRFLCRTTERGLSSAVIHGFKHAVGDVVVCMDADLSHPPDKLPELVHAILTDHADFALGSRYVKGGSTDAQWTLFRHLNSRVATLMARPLTSIRDPMSGFFALKRDRFLAASDLNPIGYKIGLELLVKTGSRNVREVPIHFADRTRGKSKLSARQQWMYVLHLRRLMWYKLTHQSRTSKTVKSR
ncbi:MAG TPA: polyprenol monophosphomannose synthase [Phycisphaerales bacterium]|nr:polyprenol monophosphomannose synthase [Phycisphaerales bacterium]